jgi:hypothetical protein
MKKMQVKRNLNHLKQRSCVYTMAKNHTKLASFKNAKYFLRSLKPASLACFSP